MCSPQRFLLGSLIELQSIEPSSIEHIAKSGKEIVATAVQWMCPPEHNKLVTAYLYQGVM